MAPVDVVFHVAELLEMILLALPGDTTHEEIAAMRTILLGRTTCRTWHCLIDESNAIRTKLYLSTPLDVASRRAWHVESVFPPSRPNPWIPHLLLNQRSWGSAYPFDGTDSIFKVDLSQPKYWTFSFELSRNQFVRLPPSGSWRDMQASSPCFTDLWATRAFYELGSGRAPFVTHLDYNPSVLKSQQRYHGHYPEGVTLGAIVDVIGQVFDDYPAARFVMIESVRGDGTEEQHMTKAYLPGSSAEHEYGWTRE